MTGKSLRTMTTRELATLAPLLLPALLLSGCIDVRQDIYINPDGTGRLRLDIGIRSTTADPAAEVIPEHPGEDLKVIARRIHTDPRVRTIHVEEYSEDGWDRGVIDLSVHDWRDLPELNRLLAADPDRAEHVFSGLERWFLFSLGEEEDGVIDFRQPGSDDGSPASVAVKGTLFGREWDPSAFTEGALTVTLHSPMVSRTNGLWQLDKASIRWTVPLASLEGSSPPPAFTAEIGPSARSSHFWRVVGIILAVTALVGLLAWFRRSRREAREMERERVV
jgi:hypothetical protein